jgi:hypothetical protein
MAEIPVLERLTASDLFLVQSNDFGWSSDSGGLAILDGTDPRLCLRRPIAIASRDCYSRPWARRPSEEADDELGEVGRM